MLSDATKRLIVKAYQAGNAVPAICEAAEITVPRFYAILREAGIVPAKDRKPRTRPASPMTRAVEQHILEAHAHGRWIESEELRRRTGATPSQISATRARLYAAGKIKKKGDYHVCYLCGEPAMAREMCALHYTQARRILSKRERSHA